MGYQLYAHPRYKADERNVLVYTGEHWGDEQKYEYVALILEALAKLAVSPTTHGSARVDIHPMARVFRIAQPGRRAAHVILYAVVEPGSVWFPHGKALLQGVLKPRPRSQLLRRHAPQHT